MKQNNVKSLPRLENEKYENIFNVYQTTDKKYFYNLLQSVVLPENLPSALLESYIVKYGDTWPLISFKHYQTPNLWWVILETNKLMDATKMPPQGTAIKIPTKTLVKMILGKIYGQ
jgi:nucleoid-associated protein YgaU